MFANEKSLELDLSKDLTVMKVFSINFSGAGIFSLGHPLWKYIEGDGDQLIMNMITRIRYQPYKGQTTKAKKVADTGWFF